jgi:hypothetical protein
MNSIARNEMAFIVEILEIPTLLDTFLRSATQVGGREEER